VRDEVMVTVRRAIMFKVKMHFVVTNHHRVLIMRENYSAVRGELNMTGETPTVTPKGDTGLEVVDGDERSESFEFADTESRNRWAGILTRLLKVDELSG
jgi:S-formylglutathione hydrolase FrmB